MIFGCFVVVVFVFFFVSSEQEENAMIAKQSARILFIF
ncbi:hypothetical protein JCM19274_1293 [Algibacter lectus]|uniref:Uncharacterized protein n=1 Tax=Algibacter lectus TaxID=221126 RepID=A0A090X650_9FLAO|nr:hypothetical protein JCM19274_1293 [Algibacter lectus]